MSHQDGTDVRTNLQTFKAALKDLLEQGLGDVVRHGNAVFDPCWLACAGLACWGWTKGSTLDQRIDTSRTLANRVFSTNHSVTRQGLMKAMASCETLLERVVDAMVSKSQGLRDAWNSGANLDFVVDGTKFLAPRTAANQARFSAAANRKNKRYKNASDQSKAMTAQVLTTVLYHLGTGLPYRWRVGEANASERNQLLEMLDDLPAKARLIADAEYVGFKLWNGIHQSGRTFVVRVGANVRLIKNLGKRKYRDGYVYYWPKQTQRQNGPMLLRLIRIQHGRRKYYLLTNDLTMSDEEARDLYAKRWGIELFFRSIKQSCERSKLCCCTPTNIVTEINWTLLGIWFALYKGKETLEKTRANKRFSPVKVVRAFEAAVVAIATAAKRARLLEEMLTEAIIIDEPHRRTSKKSRSYPRKRKRKASGPPTIRPPTTEERKAAARFLC